MLCRPVVSTWSETDTYIQTQEATTKESFLLKVQDGNLLHMFKSMVTDVLKIDCFISLFTYQWQIHLTKLKFDKHCNSNFHFRKQFRKDHNVCFFILDFLFDFYKFCRFLWFIGGIYWAICPRILFDNTTLERRGFHCILHNGHLWCPSLIGVHTWGLSIHWRSLCLNFRTFRPVPKLKT